MSFPSDEAVQAAREAVGSKLGGAGAFAAIAVDEPKIRKDAEAKLIERSEPLREWERKIRADERRRIVDAALHGDLDLHRLAQLAHLDRRNGTTEAADYIEREFGT